MTSFAFIAGLIPLVRATGAGAISNKTIGASAMGGMLFGTIFGVIVVPGLYYLLAKMSEGKQLIRDEAVNPLSEDFVEHQDEDMSRGKLKKLIKKFLKQHDAE